MFDIQMKINGISILKSNFCPDWNIESLTLSEKKKLIKKMKQKQIILKLKIIQK